MAHRVSSFGWTALVLLGIVLAVAFPGSERVPLASAASADRFGVVMLNASDAVVQHTLQQLGLSWWYSFADSAGAPAGTQRVLLLRTSPSPAAPKSADELRQWAQRQPGAYYLVGNEPNVPGQDNVTPERYAELLQYYATTIKNIDPTAKLVGPNILNWTVTCSGCAGFTSGQTWTTQLITSYQERYGTAPPLDVWGIHAYTITWDRLPMVDADTGIRQLQEFRTYLNSLVAERDKPIWLTEFGVIWGYEGYQTVSNDQCASRTNCLGPTGSYRSDLISSYLTTLLEWLTANADANRIERWFLYASYGFPEPYASLYAGISLMTTAGTDAGPTSFGERYRTLAGLPVTPAAPTPTTPPSPGGGGGGTGGNATPTPSPTATAVPTGTAPTPESRSVTVPVDAGGTVSAGSVQIQVPAGVISGGGNATIQVEPLTAEPALSQQEIQPLVNALRVPAAPEGQILGSQLFSVKVLDGAGSAVEQLARPLTIVNQAGLEDARRSGNRADGLRLARLDPAGNTWATLEGTADLTTRNVTGSTDRTGIIALVVTIPAARLQEPAPGTLSVDMAPVLRWEVPANAVWHQVQVLPAQNDGPAINLIIGAPDLVAAGRYEVPAPRLGVGNYIMLPGMSYTWRVRMSTLTTPVSEAGPGWSAWDARTFRTAAPTSVTIAPVSPAVGTTTAGLTPRLTWSNLTDRVFYYEVQLSKDPNFEADPNRAVAAVYWELVHGGQTAPNNSYQVREDYPLEPASLYHWRVRPRVQGDGIPVDWSSTWTFMTP